MEKTKTSKKNRAEQKKLLMQLEKEIKDLEFKVNHTDLYNKKIGTIRNLKIGARALRVFAPYIITAGIVTGGFLACGVTPFGKNQMKEYSATMKEFDVNGNVRCTQQYGEFGNDVNKIYYYSKWQYDGQLYSRDVKVYKAEDLNYEEMLKYLDYSNVKLEDILGKPTSNYKETTNNVEDADLKCEGHLKAVMYSYDKKDYVFRDFSLYENVGITLAYLLTVLFVQIIPGIYREKFPFEFEEEMEKIKDRYCPLKEADIPSLKMNLKTSKSNYKVLTR